MKKTPKKNLGGKSKPKLGYKKGGKAKMQGGGMPPMIPPSTAPMMPPMPPEKPAKAKKKSKKAKSKKLSKKPV